MSHISATGEPIHFMFGSRVGFSGSADRMALFTVTSNPSWRLTDILDNFEWPYLRNGSFDLLYIYSAHRAVIFAIAQLSCLYCDYVWQATRWPSLKLYNYTAPPILNYAGPYRRDDALFQPTRQVAAASGAQPSFELEMTCYTASNGRLLFNWRYINTRIHSFIHSWNQPGQVHVTDSWGLTAFNHASEKISRFSAFSKTVRDILIVNTERQ